MRLAANGRVVAEEEARAWQTGRNGLTRIARPGISWRANSNPG